MRVVSLLFYLFFFLLGGKGHAFTVKQDSNNCAFPTTAFEKNHDLKLPNGGFEITLIEDIDISLDEEFHSENDTKLTFSTGRHVLVNTLYVKELQLHALNYSNKLSKDFPRLCGNPCPIYIVHRVLRI